MGVDGAEQTNGDECFFFEGTEKLLEVWFTKEDGPVGIENDLRLIPRQCIDQILDIVNCKILSVTKSRDLDSYVLSESSLFINKNRLLIKTCGTTTLLHAVMPIMTMAFKYSGYDSIRDLFYSRKRFMRPDLQKAPHTSFEEEVEYLQDMFGGGAAYALGRMNSDCWYMYTLHKPKSIEEGDQTLEIIMTKLDPEVMSIFTQECSKTAQEATIKAKIDTIFPNAILDAYLFEPCGYSVNAILPKGYYFNMHITPEAHCSYVSFETDAPEKSYVDLIRKILDLFKPEQFIITFFANENAVHKTLGKKELTFSAFDVDTFQETRVKNYNVIYSHYTKKPI